MGGWKSCVGEEEGGREAGIKESWFGEEEGGRGAGIKQSWFGRQAACHCCECSSVKREREPLSCVSTSSNPGTCENKPSD